MSYLKNALVGFSWMGAFRVISRIGAFARIAILARILSPTQFGVFGIASLMLILLETFTQTGINIYLIQERKKLKVYVSTAWVVSIIRGTIITLVLLLAAPLIANFFNAKDAIPLLMLISVVAFIRGFINPSRIRFQKDLEFKKEFLFSSSVFFADTIAAIGLSYILQSPIGLVWGLVAGAIVEVILSFAMIKPIPKLTFEIEKVKDIIGKGKWITAAGIFNYAFQQGDDLVVGKLLNTASLGIYQAAYKLSTLPITEVTQVVNQVTFPVYSKIAGDRYRLKKAFLKTTLGISAIVIPIGLILFYFPNQIVLIILGKKWLAVAPVLRILSIFGVIRSLTISTNAIFNSVKKQKYITFVTFVSLLVMVISIIPLVLKWGLIGAGISVLIASIAVLPVAYLLLMRILKDKG